MNTTQRAIAVVTLAGTAAFMGVFYCDWVVGSQQTLDSTMNGGGSRTIIALGSNTGILSRAPESAGLDATLGVAVPLLLAGTAAYLAAAGSHKSESADLELESRKV